MGRWWQVIPSLNKTCPVLVSNVALPMFPLCAIPECPKRTNRSLHNDEQNFELAVVASECMLMKLANWDFCKEHSRRSIPNVPPLTCQFLYCYRRRTKLIEAMWSNTWVSCSRDVCVSSMTLDTKNKWQWMIILENRAGTTFVLWLFCLTFQKKAQIWHLTTPIHTLCSSWLVSLWSNTL